MLSIIQMALNDALETGWCYLKNLSNSLGEKTCLQYTVQLDIWTTFMKAIWEKKRERRASWYCCWLQFITLQNMKTRNKRVIFGCSVWN